MLGVAKIISSVSVCACCVCGVHVLVSMSVGVGVFLVVSELFNFGYNYYTHLILFFAFLYPRNLPPGHITKPFLASQLVDIEVFDQHQDDHSDDKFIC